MPDDILNWSVGIVGPGRAASAFARSWIAAGGSIEHVIARDPAEPVRAANRLKSGHLHAADSASFRCDLLILGVPDDSIAAVANQIGARISCRFAFHLSGALGAEEIAALRRGGASLGSLHPVRAFSGEPDETWRGAFVAIEGDEPALSVGERIATAIGARGWRLSADAKTIYHAAATLVAGGTLALVSAGTRVWASLGIPEEEGRAALADLSSRASAAATHRAFEDAWTGPLARRDLSTVRTHRAALVNWPDLLRLYEVLARETLARTPGRGKEEEVLAVLGEGHPSRR